MNSSELNKSKSEVIKKARGLLDNPQGENGDLSQEQVEQYSAFEKEIQSLDQKIERFSRLEKLESENKESAGRISNPEPIHEDIERYSVVRAMRQSIEHGRLSGLEKEVNDEVYKKTGKAPKGFYMPLNLKTETYGNLDSTTGAGGMHTVKAYENFIDLLRNKVLLAELGAQFLTDLNGAISIPKQTGGATAYWIDGNGTSTITDSNQSIGQVGLSPSTLGARTKYSRNFLNQTSIDVENFVRNDLAAVVAIELDRVGFNGSGSGAVPEGILQNSSVGSVTLGDDGANPTFAKLVEMETKVAVGNADIGNLAYVTTPAGRGFLKSTPVVSGNPRMIWENDQIIGYQAHATNQLPSNLTKGEGTGLSAALFGNFNDAIFGLWGALDVLVNPYTADAAGAIIITALQDCDFAIRHPASFCKIVDFKTV